MWAISPTSRPSRDACALTPASPSPAAPIAASASPTASGRAKRRPRDCSRPHRGGAALARGHGFHHLEGPLEAHAARVEVGFEKKLGQPRLGIASNVLANLFEIAPERA